MQTSTRQYGTAVFKKLEEHYPDAGMILKWGNNWELLVAIILSAQCTDVMVNKVTTKLFPKYKQEKQELRCKYQEYKKLIEHKVSRDSSEIPKQVRDDSERILDDKFDGEEFIELVNFAEVSIEELEEDVRSTGFYKNKAKNVKEAAKMVLEKYQGVLPRTIQELTMIPGVGRKTANVFLGNAYGIYEGIAVDTHVRKQGQVLGLTKQTDPDKIEQNLMALFDKKDWFKLTYLLIEHGRNLRKRRGERIVCGDEKCILCGQIN